MEPPIKAPPHALEAERALLGGLLLDNQAFERVGFLEPEHFYRDDHRRIFAAIAGLIERGRAADMVLVCEHLEASHEIDKAGGRPYVAGLAQNAVSTFNILRYAELVRDKAILRQLLQHSTEIAERSLAGAESPRAIAEDAEVAFLSVLDTGAPSEMVGFATALVEAVEWADNPVKGLSTNFHELDRILTGLMPGDLIIVAGRPSMGKTALAMNIAEHVARSKPVAVFSLEMTRRKIAARSLRYHEAQLGRDGAVDHLSNLKLFIDESPAIGLGYMRLRLRRIKRNHGLALVVIDYLQLVTARGENRTQEISAVSRGLKSIAKEFNVPVIAVAQLNRGAEGRTDRRPMLSDLRESGQIEQDADVIAFVYREEYYKPDTTWKGITEVLVRKNRDGPTDTAYLGFVPEYTRFHNREGLLPPRDDEKASAKVASFADFKGKAAGE